MNTRITVLCLALLGLLAPVVCVQAQGPGNTPAPKETQPPAPASQDYWYEITCEVGQEVVVMAGRSKAEPKDFNQLLTGQLPVLLEDVKDQITEEYKEAGTGKIVKIKKWVLRLKSRRTVYIMPRVICFAAPLPEPPS